MEILLGPRLILQLFYYFFLNANNKDVEKQRLIESSDIQCGENHFAILYVFRLFSVQEQGNDSSHYSLFHHLYS